MGDRIQVGHVFRSEKASLSQLVLQDDSVINMLPETSLRINQYAYATVSSGINVSPEANPKVTNYSYSTKNFRIATVIQILNGQARFIIYNPRRTNDSKFTVVTTQAFIIAGISDFFIHVNPTETEVAVLENSVRVKNISPLVVGEIKLEVNQKTVVRNKTQPAKPILFNSNQRSRYLSEATY